MHRIFNEVFKTEYEKITESKISTATWYRIKSAIIDNGLDVDLDSSRLIGEVKKTIGTSKVSLSAALRAYLEICRTKGQYRGSDIFRELQKITNCKCSNRSIIRWFSDVPKDSKGHRYDSDRLYRADELRSVFLKAYSFKVRKKM